MSSFTSDPRLVVDRPSPNVSITHHVGWTGDSDVTGATGRRRPPRNSRLSIPRRPHLRWTHGRETVSLLDVYLLRQDLVRVRLTPLVNKGTTPFPSHTPSVDLTPTPTLLDRRRPGPAYLNETTSPSPLSFPPSGLVGKGGSHLPYSHPHVLPPGTSWWIRSDPGNLT